jgi:hypothetical protein
MKLGLKVAPNISWMNPGTKGYSPDGARIGATLGFTGDFYFTDNYAFSTGLNFLYTGGKLAFTDSVMSPDDKEVRNAMVNRKYDFVYIEIPMMIKMHTKQFGDFSFFGQIGFGTGFRLKATATDNIEPDASDAYEEQYNVSGETTLIRESILVGLGTEYHLDESTRLTIGLNYSNSLNNVLTGVNYKSNLTEKSMLNFAELSLSILF